MNLRETWHVMILPVSAVVQTITHVTEQILQRHTQCCPRHISWVINTAADYSALSDFDSLSKSMSVLSVLIKLSPISNILIYFFCAISHNLPFSGITTAVYAAVAMDFCHVK